MEKAEPEETVVANGEAPTTTDEEVAAPEPIKSVQQEDDKAEDDGNTADGSTADGSTAAEENDVSASDKNTMTPDAVHNLEDEQSSENKERPTQTPEAAAEENDASASSENTETPDVEHLAEADENKAKEGKFSENEEKSSEKPEVSQPDVVQDAEESPASETKERAPEELTKESSPTDSKDEEKAPLETDAAGVTGGARALEASSVPAPDVNFTGTWKCVRNDNLEEYLKEVGMNFLMRKIAVRTSPTCEMKQDGNHFQVKMMTGFFSQQAEFNIGEEYSANTPFGDKAKCISHWEDKKLVTESRPEAEKKKGLNQLATREIVDGELLLTLKTGEVVAKRYFQKVD